MKGKGSSLSLSLSPLNIFLRRSFLVVVFSPLPSRLLFSSFLLTSNPSS